MWRDVAEESGRWHCHVHGRNIGSSRSVHAKGSRRLGIATLAILPLSIIGFSLIRTIAFTYPSTGHLSGSRLLPGNSQRRPLVEVPHDAAAQTSPKLIGSWAREVLTLAVACGFIAAIAATSTTRSYFQSLNPAFTIAEPAGLIEAALLPGASLCGIAAVGAATISTRGTRQQLTDSVQHMSTSAAMAGVAAGLCIGTMPSLAQPNLPEEPTDEMVINIGGKRYIAKIDEKSEKNGQQSGLISLMPKTPPFILQEQKLAELERMAPIEAAAAEAKKKKGKEGAFDGNPALMQAKDNGTLLFIAAVAGSFATKLAFDYLFPPEEEEEEYVPAVKAPPAPDPKPKPKPDAKADAKPDPKPKPKGK